jgi:serine/threonine protein phosphatase PrpC
MPVHLTIYAQTDTGLVRPQNEDSFVACDLTSGGVVEPMHLTRVELGSRGALLAVSDGLGGHKAGEVASALVVDSLRRSLSDRPGGEPADRLMEDATVQANREVWEAAHVPGRERMGATLTAVLVQDSTAYIAEVGDSRAYLLRAGAVTQITRDQSFVQLMMDKGALSPGDAEHSPLQNVVLQAMGLERDVSVALGKLELRRRDALVLCSDGLSGKVSPEEMRDTIAGDPRLDVACARLVELAKQRGGEDNITIVAAGAGGDLRMPASNERIADAVQVLREFEARPR